MPKRGLEPPHLTIYAPKAYVATITPLGQGSQGRGRTSKQLVQSEVTLPICLLGIKLIPWNSTGLKVSGQNRTDDKSFADSCLTTWRQTH